MKLKNIILALQDQLPWKRFFINFFVTGNARGLLHKRSHYRDNGNSKQSYLKRSSAEKASQSMEKKYKYKYSVYKCLFCDGYHIGKNRTSVEKFNNENITVENTKVNL